MTESKLESNTTSQSNESTSITIPLAPIEKFIQTQHKGFTYGIEKYDPQALVPYETIQQFLDMVKDVFNIELEAREIIPGEIATRLKGTKCNWRTSLTRQYERPHPDTVRERRAARKEARRATAWERSVKRAEKTLAHYSHNALKAYQELEDARIRMVFFENTIKYHMNIEHSTVGTYLSKYMFRDYPRCDKIQKCMGNVLGNGMPINGDADLEIYKAADKAYAAFQRIKNRVFRLELSLLAAQTILNLVLQEKHN